MGEVIANLPFHTSKWQQQFTGDIWVQCQDALPEGGVLAAVQLFSDKTLLNFKGLSAHPIMAALLNVNVSERSRKAIAYFPFLKQPPGLSDEQFKRLKSAALQKCLDVLLLPLKQMSATGLVCTDPSGRLQNIFPAVISYVGDTPEHKDMLCLYHGHQCAFPCEKCWIAGQDLSQLQTTAELRGEAEHRAKVLQIQGEPQRGRAKELAKSFSIHPCMPSLFGFARHGNAYGDYIPHQATGFDMMHTMDLGIFLYIVDNLGQYAARLPNAERAAALRLARNLNTRLQAVPRIEGFDLSFSEGSLYFQDDGHLPWVQAKQHRMVMQILPNLLQGLDLVDSRDSLTELSCR